MSRHSPGPWIADGPPDNIHILEAERPFMRICFLTSNGPTEANGQLIAAAPDLLQELISITDQLERIGDTRWHKDGQFIYNARVAIAKATGAEPPEEPE